MDKLSIEEIKRMLEDSCPSEIMEREGERLDEAGLRLLDQETSALKEVDALLEGFGREFQSDLPPAPKIQLPGDEQTADNVVWLHRKTPVSNIWLSVAALLFAGVLGLILANGGPEAAPVDPSLIGDHVRAVPADLDGLEPLNQDLFNAHLARGVHLLDAGSKSNDMNLVKLALTDFQAAHELGPEHKRLLQYLARAHEKLGQSDLAEQFLEKSLR